MRHENEARPYNIEKAAIWHVDLLPITETTTWRRQRPRGIPIVRAVNEFVPARDTRAQSLVVSRSLSAT